MLRRFVFQGIEAGYIAGFGIIAGNLFWLASIIFGWRFFVIPWLSLDILRYLLGFVILIKYMWHASHDERQSSTLTNLSKSKIFLVTFLLALTEQTNLYPFVTNMSIGAESTLLENFPVDNLAQFIFIHSAYLLGIFAGSLSLLHFTCWLWENPIYKIYLWFISNSFPISLPKIPKQNYYKYLNFIFLYLTMLCTISSIPYFGLDYTLTNPLGFISDDLALTTINKKTNQQAFPEISFLNTLASDRNTRDARGRHGRRERWKDRLIKYRGMDTSLYDQSVYDLFTIEDLNYGFDKFWLRRKIKNHHSRFRMVIFQPWLLSLKKQLAKPRLISNEGVRVELFRMLYEQFYHPNFHAYASNNKLTKKDIKNSTNLETTQLMLKNTKSETLLRIKKSESALFSSGYTDKKTINKQDNIFTKNTQFEKDKLDNITLASIPFPASLSLSSKGKEHASASQIKLGKETEGIRKKDLFGFALITQPGSEVYGEGHQDIFKKTSALRKFVRKINTRIKSAQILLKPTNLTNINKAIYSKQFQFFINPNLTKVPNFSSDFNSTNNLNISLNQINKHISNQTRIKDKENLSNIIKKKDRQILRYKTLLKNAKPGNWPLDTQELHNAKVMLHPIKFYLQKEKALKRKWKFYGANIYRKLSIENNAPYFRVMMRRLFYYYKPTLRLSNTLKLAKNKQGHKVRRKKSRVPLRSAGLQLISNKNEEVDYGRNTIQNNSLALNTASGTLNNSQSLQLRGAPNWRYEKEAEQGLEEKPFLAKLIAPTHNYRVVGKNASQMRAKIYKDVLHHWYYTPFNRLLLKFDIDAFIRRQPNSHFLTKNEEQELHLKRFLLAEHYDTLRWYTYMQHYRSMKTNIGGTKSFASKIYNHQFQGTFKKIRHLFAITPTIFSDGPPLRSQTSFSFGNVGASLPEEPDNVVRGPFKKETSSIYTKQNLNIKPVLKFDQPLYNEYSNTQKKSIINESVIHEELLSNPSNSLAPNKISLARDSYLFPPLGDEERKSLLKELSPLNNETKLVVYNKNPIKSIPNQAPLNDLISQSTLFLKDYLKTSKEKRQIIIKNFLINKNYKELTKFFFTGQKTRGIKATTNQLLLNKQENEYLNLIKQSLPTSFSIQKSKHSYKNINSKNNNFFFPSYSLSASSKATQALNASHLDSFVQKFKNDSYVSKFNIKRKIEQDLWFSFLKNYKKGLYDQEFLTKFLERRIKKKEKRQQKKEKELKNRLKRLNIWLAPNPLGIYSPQKSFAAEQNNFFTTGMKKAIQDGVLNIKKEPQNSIKIFDSIPSPSTYGGKGIFLKTPKAGSFFQVQHSQNLSNQVGFLKTGQAALNANIKIEQTEALPNSFSSVNSILIKLNNEKKFKKQNKIFINNAEMLIYTTFLKTKIFSQVISIKLKALIKLSVSSAKKKFVKPLLQKDSILTWEIKDKMLKKRKRSRKKYPKEIKKARLAQPKTTLSSTFTKEQALLNQNPSLTAGKSALVASSLNDLNYRQSLYLGIDQPWLRAEHGTKGLLRRGMEWKRSWKSCSALLTPVKIENSNFAYPKVAPIFFKKRGKGKKISSFKQIELINKTKTQAQPLYSLSSFKIADSKNLNETEKRKKKLSENEIIKSIVTKFDKINLNKKESDFLYFKTLSGTKLGLNQKFKRKKTKNRRNQRYGRPHYRVEHPSLNANLERKSANMVPEKRLQILKEQATLNYGLTSFNNNGAAIKEPIDSFRTKKANLALNPKKRKSKKRTWKKYKKGINNEKLRKARKHNRDTIAAQHTKILTKQMKRIKLSLKLQKWWWKQFLPNINTNQSSALITESNWHLEKERQLEKTISKLSKTEILERDFINVSNGQLNNKLSSPELQIGDYDFKPLAIPQALRIQFVQEPKTSRNKYGRSKTGFIFAEHKKGSFFAALPFLPTERKEQKETPIVEPIAIKENSNEKNNNKQNLSPNNKVINVSETQVKSEADKTKLDFLPYSAAEQKNTTNKQLILTTNPLPFYAGWDESLRKFVVTNRLLSRREAGYSFYDYKITETDSKKLPYNILSSGAKLSFPLQGMNAGTTLYCQVPFTTFAPDQLLSLGMNGFAPIGWRRFDFTHTIFKTQSLLKKNQNQAKLKNDIFIVPASMAANKNKTGSSTNNSNTLKPLVIKNGAWPNQHGAKGEVDKQSLFINEWQSHLFSLKLENKIKKISFKKTYSQEFDVIKKYTNYSRRFKKHYKRIKKLHNEKVPVFLISGPLINEVLPIHYINVFNKQNRLSRDRYLKRRLRRGKKGIPKAMKEFTTKNASEIITLNNEINNNKSDFTLRRRIKTRRKYHRKPYPTKGIEIRPRRHKFVTVLNTKLPDRFGMLKHASFGQLTPTQPRKKDNKKHETLLRKRPSKRKLKKNTAKLNQSRDYEGYGGLTSKTRQRQKIKKTGALNARLRQLRRRVSRQVLKTVPRRRPRAGGFLWPGDYLRLEQTESPKFIVPANIAAYKTAETKSSQLPTLSKSNDKLRADKLKESNKQKITRKIDKKALLLDLYVQPRKYLLEKHNIKVLKKKLEKAQRPNLL